MARRYRDAFRLGVHEVMPIAVSPEPPADLADKIGERIAAERDAAGRWPTRSLLPWAAALALSCAL